MGILEDNNHSLINEFVLIGFSDSPYQNICLFFVFLIIYIVSILGNIGIIYLVCTNIRFHTPMYFFLSNLSVVDLVYASDIAPKMLVGLYFSRTPISYVGCAIQLFIFCALGSTECVLFAVMAYDRFVAICNPLSYNLIMQHKTCLGLMLGAYSTGFLHSLIETCCTFHLSFCASNVLHHFVCDFPPLLSISCTDTTINEMILFIFSSSVTVPSIVVILGSYMSIFIAILKITAPEGRQRAYSTCASHIVAVTLLYSTVLYVYLSPKSPASRDNVNMATVFYTVVLPMLNPLIYSLRNKDIKLAIIQSFQSIL
ncbi:olfactory receptor 1019-like [Bufo gargarizans]|uniref:olfactory receptor 1019-like n=1 Tax=Bufo gargarizans TaxID=30331 RepID=UPI001CF16CB0|nr:olfactory receptor 1019-like [Bufo gargarizans]